MLLLWLTCTSMVYAAPKLSLKEAVVLALRTNPDLQAARANVAIAKARLIQAGLWPNPNLNLTNLDDKVFKDEGEYTRSIELTQALPISGRLGAQKRVACVDVIKAIAEIKDAERQLSNNVANAFYALLLTGRRLQQQDYLLNLNRQLVEVTHERYLAAEVSELDTNTARLEYQRLHQERHLLETVRINQLAQLNQYLGREASASLHLHLTLPKQGPWPSLSVLQRIALHNRPDRKAALLTIKRAGSDIQLARVERFADWTLGIKFQQEKIVVEGAPPQQADRLLGVGLTIPLPLFNANQGRILEASATGTKGLMTLRALDLAIKNQVASSYAQVRLLQHTLYETQFQSLSLTRKNVQLARDAYKQGMLSLLNMVQVQRQQNEFQLTYLTNLEKYLQTFVALCTAIGVGSPKIPCDYLPYKKELKCMPSCNGAQKRFTK